jgi:endonuclease/exonuclease/phosphatase family metal-dependent hydrolase
MRDGRGRWVWATAILGVAMGFVAIRVTIPGIYGLRETRGVGAAVLLALACAGAPVAAAPLTRLVNERMAMGFAGLGLSAAMIAMSIVGSIPLWLASISMVLTLVLWSLLIQVVRSPEPGLGPRFALAFVIGSTIDTAIHGASGTLDLPWRAGAASSATIIVLAGALALAVVKALPSIPSPREARFIHVVPVAGIGPFMALQLAFLHDVGSVDAFVGLSSRSSAALVLAGEGLTLAALVWSRPVWTNHRVRAIGSISLVGTTWLMTGVGGTAGALCFLAASVLSTLLFASALSRGDAETLQLDGSWRTLLACGAGTATMMLLLLIYQLHVIAPLPITNRILPPIAAALLGLAAAGNIHVVWAREVRRLTGLSLAATLGLVAFFMLPVAPPSPVAAGRTLTVVDWNVHSGVDGGGQIDPEALASEIEASQPDVVVLQEVARGWPLAGSIDLAEWLSHRLDMAYVWGPAADRQFGNLVFSRLPILDQQVVALPYGEGPQHRSFIRVLVEAGDAPVTVIGAHLEGEEPTRSEQIKAMLGAVADPTRTIIAGDMNMQPNDLDSIAAFSRAGFISAQDESGDAAVSTARTPSFPRDRPDWIFLTPDLSLSAFEIGDSEASDHLPLIVSLAV